MSPNPATAFVRPAWAWPRTVSSVLVEGPQGEPLTLAEGKLRAGLDWPTTDPEDPRDQLMRDFIAAARDKVERDTGLALLTQTREITITVPTGALGPIVPLPWQALPCQEIEELTVNGRRLARGTFAVGPDGLTLPADVVLQTATLRVVAGWPNVGALRAEAPGLLQAVGLLVAHYATAGRDLAVLGTPVAANVQGYEDTIQPYRLEWLT